MGDGGGEGGVEGRGNGGEERGAYPKRSTGWGNKRTRNVTPLVVVVIVIVLSMLRKIE